MVSIVLTHFAGCLSLQSKEGHYWQRMCRQWVRTVCMKQKLHDFVRFSLSLFFFALPALACVHPITICIRWNDCCSLVVYFGCFSLAPLLLFVNLSEQYFQVFGLASIHSRQLSPVVCVCVRLVVVAGSWCCCYCFAHQVIKGSEEVR